MWTLVSVEIITDTTGKQMGRGGRGESGRVGDVIGGVESKRERRVREREREREGGERVSGEDQAETARVFSALVLADSDAAPCLCRSSPSSDFSATLHLVLSRLTPPPPGVTATAPDASL